MLSHATHVSSKTPGSVQAAKLLYEIPSSTLTRASKYRKVLKESQKRKKL